MRVLVTWGTKLGGTEKIAKIIGEVLQREGFDVDSCSAEAARDVGRYGAVIVGGALYANRWHKHARRFIEKNISALRRIPVWTFSSGPLDESADDGKIPPTKQVQVLMERVGALGHATFGGRLRPDARGFPAAAMAKTNSGDWTNPDRIRAWATEVAKLLPDARPRPAIEPPGRSLARLVVHAAVGWAVCAAVMGGLLQLTSTGVAVAVHAVVAPLVFAAIAVSYFRGRGARDALFTALSFVLIVALLDAAVVAGVVLGSFAMFASFVGTWLPLALIFLMTWSIGAMMSTMPWPKPPPKGTTAPRPTAVAAAR